MTVYLGLAGRVAGHPPDTIMNFFFLKQKKMGLA